MQELTSLPHYYKMTQHPPIPSFPGWCQRRPSRESLPGDNKLYPAPPTPSMSAETISGSLDLHFHSSTKEPTHPSCGWGGQRRPVGSQDFYHHPVVMRPPLPWVWVEATWGTPTRHIYPSRPEGYQQKLNEAPECPLPHSSKEARTSNVNSLSEKPGY